MVSFPYNLGLTEHHSHAAVPASSGSSSSGSSLAPNNPSDIGYASKPPSTPVATTGPAGDVNGSNSVITGTVAASAQISGSGLKPNSFVEAWVFSEPTYVGKISIDATGSFDSELMLPKTLLPGEHALQVGTLIVYGQLVTISIPITIRDKVTVGTLKGYIAIYTQDLFGQKLSAKVAGKWMVQNSLARFKNYNFSRMVRYTGSGYDIHVDVYINRKFFTRVKPERGRGNLTSQ